MRIDNNDSISTNVSANVSVNNSSASLSATLSKKASEIDVEKANNLQSGKDWSRSNAKSISQLNEYDKGNRQYASIRKSRN